MLYQHLTNPKHPTRIAVVDGTSSATYADLAQAATELAQQFASFTGQRVGIRLPARGVSLAALAALDALQCHVFLLDSLSPTSHSARLAEQFDLQAVLLAPEHSHRWSVINNVCNDPVTPTGQPGSVTILTSGTEGQPKAARHTWQSLAGPVKVRAIGVDDPAERWLLSYRIHLYAGLQVVLHAIRNEGTLVMPPVDARVEEVVTMMRDQQVAYVSATPSYWRRLLLMADSHALGQIPLRQITLGGEAVDQPLLDRLAQVFPATRITHIYATTELGRCFAVHDGQAGFPASYLERASDEGVELKEADGQLWVRSTHGMEGYDGQSATTADWYPTGDQIVVTNDRVHFVGRKGDMINVGGNKVQPLVVENVIRGIDGVADVRVFGVSSSIAGQLVGCEIVAAAGYELEALRARIREQISTNLAPYQRPRMIDFVPVIATTSAGKTSRSG